MGVEYVMEVNGVSVSDIHAAGRRLSGFWFRRRGPWRNPCAGDHTDRGQRRMDRSPEVGVGREGPLSDQQRRDVFLIGSTLQASNFLLEMDHGETQERARLLV